MTKLNARLVSASLAALLMAAGASQVSAQQANQAPATQPAPAVQAADISDKKLEKFADSLGEIMEDFTAKLEKTGDPAEAQQLQQQANEKMMNTVEDNELSIEEYNAINQAVQNDPQLRDRVIAMVQK
jgi:transcription initiation factor IIF auxiliary subunit